jgi:hypothetical protein
MRVPLGTQCRLKIRLKLLIIFKGKIGIDFILIDIASLMGRGLFFPLFSTNMSPLTGRYFVNRVD